MSGEHRPSRVGPRAAPGHRRRQRVDRRHRLLSPRALGARPAGPAHPQRDQPGFLAGEQRRRAARYRPLRAVPEQRHDRAAGLARGDGGHRARGSARRCDRHQAAVSVYQPDSPHRHDLRRRPAPAAHLSSRRRLAAARQQAAGIPVGHRLLPAHAAPALPGRRDVRRGLPERLRGCRPLPDGARTAADRGLLHDLVHLPLRANHRDAHRRRRRQSRAVHVALGRSDHARRARVFQDRSERHRSVPRHGRAAGRASGLDAGSRLLRRRSLRGQRADVGDERARPRTEGSAHPGRHPPDHAAGLHRTGQAPRAGEADAAGAADRRYSNPLVALLAAASRPRAYGPYEPGALRHQLPVPAAGHAAMGLLAPVPRTEPPRQAAAEHVLPGRAAAGGSSRRGLLHPAPRLLAGGPPGPAAIAPLQHGPISDRDQLARSGAVRHEAPAEGVLARILLPRRRRAGDEGLRRVVRRHVVEEDAGRAPGPCASGVPHGVHQQGGADRVVQVVRRVRVRAPCRGLRHEDPRRARLRPAGDHAAVRRADRLLHAGELLSGGFLADPRGRLLRHARAADSQRASVGRARRREPGQADAPGGGRPRRGAASRPAGIRRRRRALHMAPHGAGLRAASRNAERVVAAPDVPVADANQQLRPSDRRTGWGCGSAS